MISYRCRAGAIASGVLVSRASCSAAHRSVVSIHAKRSKSSRSKASQKAIKITTQDRDDEPVTIGTADHDPDRNGGSAVSPDDISESKHGPSRQAFGPV